MSPESVSCGEFVARHADPLLADLVPAAARLLAAADNDVLARARQADCYELLDGLCAHKLRALAVVMAVELDERGWRPAAGTGPGEPPVLEWKDAPS